MIQDRQANIDDEFDRGRIYQFLVELNTGSSSFDR